MFNLDYIVTSGLVWATGLRSLSQNKNQSFKMVFQVPGG